MALIRDAAYIPDPNDIPLDVLRGALREHQTLITRFTQLDNYYRGNHVILQREQSQKGLPNNRIVGNHAKYITDVAVGYTFGHPVTYESESATSLLDTFHDIDISSHDVDLAKDISIFGTGFELLYVATNPAIGAPMPYAAVIDPRNVFVVVDDTVEAHPLFAVHYFERRDADNRTVGWVINCYTPNNLTRYIAESLDMASATIVYRDTHYWGGVPLVEYLNNEEAQGDFEQQISLIDAYNTVASDRVNDKEQFVDAILMIKGVNLGDTALEATRFIQQLKEFKVFEAPQDADASWLTKQLAESEIEVLRTAIKSDIHEFSLVPNLTDENFASNASGVAMRYNLFGLEQLAITKERYFIRGLHQRIRLFANLLAVKGQAVDPASVTITMTRNLPTNDAETAAMIQQLSGTVSNQTLISRLSFIDDPKAEDERVRADKAEAAQIQQEAFGAQVKTDEQPEEEDEYE
jgi:SPP1 family phage portal protein